MGVVVGTGDRISARLWSACAAAPLWMSAWITIAASAHSGGLTVAKSKAAQPRTHSKSSPYYPKALVRQILPPYCVKIKMVT